MPATIPAIQKVRPEYDGLEIRDAKVPEIQPDEVLVRVRAAAICGSDLHLYQWDESIRARVTRAAADFTRGHTIGHEFCGVIEAIGASVNKPGTVQYGPIKVGDFISAESHAVCNKCYQCRQGEQHVCVNDSIIGFDRPGAFSPYIALPASCVWKNDPALPIEIAAIQEPLGNAMHAAAHFPLKNQSVVVFGVGPIGLFAVAIARSLGARKIVAVDVNEYRLSIAEKLGAVPVVQEKTKKTQQTRKLHANLSTVERLKQMCGNDGPDVALEMSGHPDAINNSISVVRRGGKVVLFGLPKNDLVPLRRYSSDLVFKGVSLQAIIGRRLYGTWEQVRDFVGNVENQKALRSIITSVVPYQQFHDSFENMIAGKEGKVVLRFDEK